MSSEPRHLAHAAARAARQSGFLAATLAAYREIERVTEPELQALLGCSGSAYLRLALCRAADVPSAEDVRRVAAFAGADPVALAYVVRRVGAVQALRGAAGAEARTALLAAREREGDPPEENNGEPLG